MKAYDDIPYRGGCHRQTHPDHLFVMAKLVNLPAAAPSGCRYLEIGSALGRNLIPMAMQLPQASFVGVDPSPVQVQAARARAKSLGVTNVQFLQLGAEDVDESLGSFDYITCHGVYSWVPPNVQAAILELCRSRLTPSGVAYVSFNTMPGWHSMLPVRDLMLFHTRAFDDPQQKIEQARAVLDMQVKAVAGEENSFAATVRGMQKQLAARNDSYLFHEYLSEHNEALYFTQFADRAWDAGLQYLGDADFHTMLVDRWPEEVARTLRPVAHDIIRVEQYMDFLSHRTFRRSLMCSQEHTLRRALDWQVLRGLRLLAEFELKGEVVVEDDSPARFHHDDVVMRIEQPLTKAAFMALFEASPASLGFEEAVDRARARLPEHCSDRDQDLETLGGDLLTAFARGLLRLRAEPEPWVSSLSERPRATAHMLQDAALDGQVSSLMHQEVWLDRPDQALLRLLDGTRDREALVDGLQAAMAQGELVMEGAGTDQPDVQRRALHKMLELRLPKLLNVGLLEA